MARNIFTYGTLIFGDIMRAVTGCNFANSRAEIEHYARFRIKQAIYPGLREQPGFVTRGKLYFNLDTQSLKFLDLFEGESYCRRPVTATTLDGEKRAAEVYLTAPEYYHLLEPSQWDPEVFKTKHLQTYLRHCERFRLRHKNQSMPVG